MLLFIKDTFADLLSFFRRPFDQYDEEASLNFKIKRLFAVLLADVIAILPILGLVAFITNQGWVDLEDHAVAEMLTQFGAVGIILIAVVFTPLLEELIFRGPLIFQRNPFVASPNAEKQASRRGWWDRRYSFIFYGFALAFALIHLMNYQVSISVLLFSPILLGAQFILGSLAGFLRVRYGFWWAYFLHALHNLIFVGFALFGGDAPTEIATVDTDDYHLKIEEVSPFAKEMDRDNTFGSDTIGYINYPLSEVITNILKEDYSIISYPTEARDPKVNLYLGRENTTGELDDLLLEELQKAYEFTIVPDPDNSEKAVVSFED
ncbi:MAG: CPBP family intramembrane glutamic endopeptidase [Bacteroidota bacterium]